MLIGFLIYEASNWTSTNLFTLSLTVSEPQPNSKIYKMNEFKARVNN